MVAFFSQTSLHSSIALLSDLSTQDINEHTFQLLELPALLHEMAKKGQRQVIPRQPESGLAAFGGIQGATQNVSEQSSESQLLPVTRKDSKNSEDLRNNATRQYLSISAVDKDAKNTQFLPLPAHESSRPTNHITSAVGGKLSEKKLDSPNRRSRERKKLIPSSQSFPMMSLREPGPPREISFTKKTDQQLQPSRSVDDTMIGTSRARFVEVASCSPNLSFQAQKRLPFVVDPQHSHKKSLFLVDSTFSNERQDAFEKRIDLSMRNKVKRRSKKKPSNSATTKDSEDSSDLQPSKQRSCPSRIGPK